MTALRRKLLRDLRRSRTQVVSIAAVVGCGVMAAMAMRGTLSAVSHARDRYYEDYRFAHVFATVKRAPESLARRIAEIPGVATVQTRVVLMATLDVPGLPEPATGQLVSVPARRQPMPNDLVLRIGHYPATGDEALVSDHFARLNSLVPGDTVGAVINGRWQRIRVAGVATSPEYVYEMGAGGFMVDNRRFGVLWMRRDALERAAGMDGAFNNVTLRLAPRASEPEVVAHLDRLLASYGAAGAFGRADQVSNAVIVDELHQLSAIGKVFPLFFICTAAFLLNIVLSRLIATQRDEIAALKAFGYTDGAVGAHYLGFAAAAVALGALLGVMGGTWLGARYTGLYANVFRFPTLAYRTDWAATMVAIAVSGGAAILGALGAVMRAVRVPPAEALRPESPARYRPLLLERVGLGSRIPTSARMVLRTLERRPWRTTASIVGVGLAGALMVAGLSPWDAVNRLMELQFEQIQREDLTVAFVEPRGARAARELRSVPGVMLVEPFRSTPVHLRFGQHVRKTQILGLEERGVLRTLRDMDGRLYQLPARGLIVPVGLSEALGVRAGDTVAVELTERGGAERQLVVAAVLNEMIGAGAYLERRTLNRLLREEDVSSGAYLTVDDAAEDAVFARLKRMPGVAGVSARAAMLDNFRKTMAENIATSVGIIVFAACVIAAGVIYNQARISLSERGRELASLRVLGFTRAEVRSMLFGEQAAVTLAGIPISFAIGTACAAWLMKLFEAERHRFPTVVHASTYVIATVVVTVAAVGAGLAIRRRLDALDLVAVLKTRE
ncbi:MAG TPA: FtsX-like permease family protein [Gemmatimonadaceae bacterium]|nr:FtsX-like permease family protein [Gemmatimonadaceae bacterium]